MSRIPEAFSEPLGPLLHFGIMERAIQFLRRWAKWSVLLATINAAALICLGVLYYYSGGTAESRVVNLTFIRDWPFVAMWWLAAGSMLALLVMLFVSILRKSRDAAWYAGAFSFALVYDFAACAVFLYLAFCQTCSWKIEQTIKGPDNRTYYLLHASPPVNGEGHGAIARRTGGNPVYCTMQVLTADEYGSARDAALLEAACRDSKPEGRKAAMLLLNTLRKSRPAGAGTTDRRGALTWGLPFNLAPAYGWTVTCCKIPYDEGPK